MNSVLFSLVLPTRDRPALVVRVLEALKAQTFQNFEVIVSDNGINALCDKAIAPFLADSRFSYKRAPYSMDMCSHWDFAIEGACGQYTTILCEKFILRPDALSCMAQNIALHQPDVVTWQFDMFDVLQTEGKQLLGDYHPLTKPGRIKFYHPQDELARRFSFDFPLFCRFNKPRDSYGKIYSGFVRGEIIEQIKTSYGRLFHPLSPDFTSMIAILNTSLKCIDINQSLMLLLNIKGMSNGEATKTSLAETKRFIESFGLNAESHWHSFPISGFGVGHNSNISAEFELIKKLSSEGPIKSLSLDIGALAFWANEDLKQVNDLSEEERVYFSALLTPWITGLTQSRYDELAANKLMSLKPASNEIYHSGLKQCHELKTNISADELAKQHWCEGIAPPRKPVRTSLMELNDAMAFFYQYNSASSELLGLNGEGIE